MEYDFLKAFPKRMKCVGLHAMLQANSSQKFIWKQLGFEGLAEQMNIIYSVLLFIMEQSLKEEICTLDNISTFIDSINEQYYKKELNFDDCHELADFIVNVVLANEGKSVYFAGFDYEQQKFENIHISYVNNKIVYDEHDVRRTSYYLTDDGYNLLLGTLEVESNLKLTIQEMIFKLHLEKQSYDRALDDVKNIFNLMRIQLQKIQAAMLRIRRNALEYSAKEYDQLLQENLDTIDRTREKFSAYRLLVQSRVQELEQDNINIHVLSTEDKEKLQNLREIYQYLHRAIDEYQKILNSHFDLEKLYTLELENITEMLMVRRFNLRRELYDKLLERPECLEHLDIFLRPLFNGNPGKSININRFLERQKVRFIEEEWEQDITEDLDDSAWEEEQKRLRLAKLALYEASLTVLLEKLIAKESLKLSELVESLTIEERDAFLPSIPVFKEIMVELLKKNTMDIADLRAEKAEFILEESSDFRLQRMVLDILEKHPDWKRITSLQVYRLPQEKPIVLKQLDEESGILKCIRCSNIMLKVSGE